VALNKREQYISWIVGAVLVLYLGYTYVVDAFYLSPLAEINKQIRTQTQALVDNKRLLEKRPAVNTEWTSLQQKGLLSDSSSANFQLASQVYGIALRSRFDLTAWNAPPSRPSNSKTDFDEFRVTARGTGSSARLAQFLLNLESAGLPARVDAVSVSTKKEGIDNLTVEFTLTGLFYSPKTTTKPGARVAASRSSTRPTVAETSPKGPEAPSTAPAAGGASDDDIIARLKARREQQMKGATADSNPPASQPASTQGSTPGGVQ
jgi:hypothetical protein